MDNLAHTLAGAALGQAGLKRKTGLAMATLMIAANLPDLDVIGLAFGENLAWRRGWTHGPIAMAVLPLLFAPLVVAFDRLQQRRGTRPPGRLPVRFGWVLLLAYVGILSHPVLDFLNTYGIRCLMPFSEEWFYGDAVFIIDVWMWSMLAIGIWASRRRERRGLPRQDRPAIAALCLVSAYCLAMGTSSIVAERMASDALVAGGAPRPEVVVASPVPVNPFRRDLTYSLGDRYGFGELNWLPQPELTFEPDLVPTNMDDPAVAEAALQSKAVADFLTWSRLPFADVERGEGTARVTIGDARYNRVPEGRFSVTTDVAE